MNVRDAAARETADQHRPGRANLACYIEYLLSFAMGPPASPDGFAGDAICQRRLLSFGRLEHDAVIPDETKGEVSCHELRQAKLLDALQYDPGSFLV